MHTRHLLYMALTVTTLNAACKRSTFLDARPDSSISIPTSIADCQALMDNDNVMNGYGISGYPSLGETGSDDYYVNNGFYAQYTPTDQNAVIWAADIYTSGEVNDWDLPYRTVLYSKVVLDALGSSTQRPQLIRIPLTMPRAALISSGVLPIFNWRRSLQNPMTTAPLIHWVFRSDRPAPSTKNLHDLP